MKLSESSIDTAVNEFIDSEIAPMSSGMGAVEQFAFGFTLGIVKRKSNNILKRLINSKVAQTLELVDESGLIDIDLAYEAASESLNKIKQLEVGGIRFTSKDLDTLYSIMQRYA